MVKLYITIKAMTNNGNHGSLFKLKHLHKFFKRNTYSMLNKGIKLGLWDVYKIARVEVPHMPRYIIYLNKWWED
jgi:hypothetical protein